MQKHLKFWFIGLIILVMGLAACGNEDSNDTQTAENTSNENNTTENGSSVDDNDDDSFSSPADDSVELLNTDPFGFNNPDEIIDLPTQTIAAGDGTVLIDVTMPYGYKFNDYAPFHGEFSSDSEAVLLSEDWQVFDGIVPDMPLRIPVNLTAGEATLTADLTIYWCEAINETLCFVDQRVVNIPLVVEDGGEENLANAVVALVPPE